MIHSVPDTTEEEALPIDILTSREYLKGQCVPSLGTSVGVMALPFRQTKPFQPSCHSRKSILGSIFTVLNACFSFKLRITVWSQSMHV